MTGSWKKQKNKILEWKKNLAKFDATAFGKSVATGEFYAAHGYAENVFGELRKLNTRTLTTLFQKVP